MTDRHPRVTWHGLPDWVAPPRDKIQATIVAAVRAATSGEVTLADLYAAVGVYGQPGKDAVNKALGALVCSGRIAKVRTGVYAKGAATAREVKP
jgi:hypothetical protein